MFTLESVILAWDFFYYRHHIVILVKVVGLQLLVRSIYEILGLSLSHIFWQEAWFRGRTYLARRNRSVEPLTQENELYFIFTQPKGWVKVIRKRIDFGIKSRNFTFTSF